MSDATTVLLTPLALLERRVLGVLIEKQKTSKSPDAYPMTLNSITTGCNQKSNRDPVTELDEDDVEETLADLQKKGLTLKITGNRVDRFRHLLYDVWRVSREEMAILAELLLRGPMTEGDLRSRASRMDEIADLDILRSLLKKLGDRNFVIYLTPADRRGAILTHGFHTASEIERYQANAPISGPATTQVMAITRSTPEASGTAIAELETRLNEAFQEIAILKEAVARLELKHGV